MIINKQGVILYRSYQSENRCVKDQRLEAQEFRCSERGYCFQQKFTRCSRNVVPIQKSKQKALAERKKSMRTRRELKHSDDGQGMPIN